jgi:hypothetical protein
MNEHESIHVVVGTFYNDDFGTHWNVRAFKDSRAANQLKVRLNQWCADHSWLPPPEDPKCKGFLGSHTYYSVEEVPLS